MKPLLFIAFTCLYMNAYIAPVTSQNNFQVFPKRVLFDANKRFENINLINMSWDTVNYSIGFIQYRMTEDGNFEEISLADPGQFFADTFIRYYPKMVTLAPRESQIIKLQLTKMHALDYPEYRSHLHIMPISSKSKLQPQIPDTTSVSVKLNAVCGLSLPCIIQTGETDSHVSISQLEFTRGEQNEHLLSVKFTREGKHSVYGKITVSYESAEGHRQEIKEIMGFAIYTPGKFRSALIGLKDLPGIDYTTGKLHIKYTSQSVKNNTMAQGSLVLNK